MFICKDKKNKMIELEIADIRNAENPSEAYILVLKEKNGNRIVPIMIGWSEARSLVLAMDRNNVPRRPTTHDLLISLADKAFFSLQYVHIFKFEEGVFFASIYMKDAKNKEFEIDSRTTDAVTLAIKCKAPIYMTDELVREKAIALEPAIEISNDTQSYSKSEEFLSDENYIDYQLQSLTVTELEEMLDGAVESEDFELASKIHAELEKRKK
jgi:bifunctional DNase/RNase